MFLIVMHFITCLVKNIDQIIIKLAAFLHAWHAWHACMIVVVIILAHYGWRRRLLFL